MRKTPVNDNSHITQTNDNSDDGRSAHVTTNIPGTDAKVHDRYDDKVMLHSDQGSQYTSRKCRKLLKSLNIEPSMSRRGNCHDNAVAESFFSNLNPEKIRRKKYKSRAQAQADVFNYIEMFYNPKRRHTSNGRVAPTVYEQRFFESQKSV